MYCISMYYVMLSIKLHGCICINVLHLFKLFKNRIKIKYLDYFLHNFPYNFWIKYVLFLTFFLTHILLAKA